MRDLKLKFLKDRIVSNKNITIMMSWEKPIMKRHAEIVCKNGGDILEIGFGMGISAGYIQQQEPKSHTIVEIHPEIAKKARNWSKDKINITIIEDDWYNVVNDLKTYDGIFYDAEQDDHMNKFYDIAKQKLLNPGGIYTFFNIQEERIHTLHGIQDKIEHEVLDIDPPENPYLNSDKYYLPMMEI